MMEYPGPYNSLPRREWPKQMRRTPNCFSTWLVKASLWAEKALRRHEQPVKPLPPAATSRPYVLN